MVASVKKSLLHCWGAVRGLLDERDLVQRALVESLKADVASLRAEVQSLRGSDQRAETLLRSFAQQAGEALPVAVAQAVQRGTTALATRVAVLEQREVSAA
jgi:hypothetical protein